MAYPSLGLSEGLLSCSTEVAARRVTWRLTLANHPQCRRLFPQTAGVAADSSCIATKDLQSLPSSTLANLDTIDTRQL